MVTPPSKPQTQRDEGVAIEEQLAASFVVKPAHPIAARYNEPYPDALDPQFDSLAGAVHAKRDVRLDFVAGELASVHSRGGLVDRTLADFFARSYGVVETVQQVGVMHAASETELKRVFGDALGFGNVRLGFGVQSGVIVVVLVYDLRVKLEPFPRAITTSAHLVGTLAAGLDHLEIRHALAGGAPVEDKHELEGSTFHALVTCPSAGPAWILLDAIDKSGPANLVQFPIVCQGDVVASYTVEPVANFTAVSPAHHLAAVIDRERRARGLPPFELLPVIERSAQELARAKSGGVTVVGPPGLAPGTSRWTAFYSDSIESAIGRLLNDPGETEALATREMNRIGVGVEAAAQGGYWIAIVYAEVPHPVDAAQAERWVAFEVKHRYKRRCEVDFRATDFAKRIATRLAHGEPRAEMQTLLKTWNLTTPEGKGRWNSTQGLFMQIESVTDLDALDLNHLVEGLQFSTYGVGVAQSAPSGTLWVVVVYNE